MGFTTRMYILAFLMTWGSYGKKQLQMFDCFFPDIDFVFGQKLNLATPSWESVEIISTAGNDHMTSPFESMIFVPTSGERWEICDRSQGSEYDCKGTLWFPFCSFKLNLNWLRRVWLASSLELWVSCCEMAIEGPKKCLPLPKITSVP